MNRGYVLCNGNSASSQMAEGWLRHLAGDRFEIGSANTQPVGLHAGSVDAMAEGGESISHTTVQNTFQSLEEKHSTI